VIVVNISDAGNETHVDCSVYWVCCRSEVLVLYTGNSFVQLSVCVEQLTMYKCRFVKSVTMYKCRLLYRLY